MGTVPVLIEVEETRNQPDINLCCKLVEFLTKGEVAPIGLVGTLDEVADVLGKIREENLAPSIFVINTFGAKAILRGVDELIGDVPTVYVRRELFAGQSGLAESLGGNSTPVTGTSLILGQMKMRLTSMWPYGSRNCEEVAERLSRAIVEFLKTGDFRVIERLRAVDPYARIKTLRRPFEKTACSGPRDEGHELQPCPMLIHAFGEQAHDEGREHFRKPGQAHGISENTAPAGGAFINIFKI